MTNMTLTNYKDLIIQNKQYIKGKILDYGAGKCKYKEIIKGNYISFDLHGDVDIIGDVLDSKLEPESFDTIICMQVGEHVNDPFKLVKEISRILKKDGYCIFSVPFIYPIHPSPNDYFRFSKDSLKYLFKNFKIEDYGQIGDIGTVLRSFINPAYFNPHKKTFRGKILTKILTKILKWISIITDKIVKSEVVYTDSYIIAKKI